MKIALTGDVMLGRLVDDEVIWNTLLPPATVWGDVLPLLLEADLRLVNLECVISQIGQKWQPEQKAFHFRASPRAIEVLQAARIDAVTLANNHILDYGPEALLECLTFLDRAGIPHTGAGRNLRDALTPMLVEFAGNRVAVVALTDNEPAWEAAEHQPGVNHVAYDRHGLLEPYRTRMAEGHQPRAASRPFRHHQRPCGPQLGRALSGHASPRTPPARSRRGSLLGAFQSYPPRH